MKTVKFKTNIKCSGCVAKVTGPLNETLGEGNWNVDLNSPTKTLSVEGELDEIKMKAALEKVGYKAETM